MAAGDIISVVIGADGWYADVTIEGLSTGGTYNLGLGSNGNPATGTPKLMLTVTSLGYDGSTATTRTRTVYGTRQVRKAYPNHAQAEESDAGGNVTVRIALSEYVYAKDKSGDGNSGTDISFTILSGLYTQGTASSGAAGTATNNSTAGYQKPVGNWSWVGFQRVTGTEFKLRCVAFHRHAADGKPVEAVKFSVTDGTNTVETTVTAATVDASLPDEVPVIEYVGTIDLATLTQGAELTCNFIAYPRIGDAVLDTSTGTAAPTPLYGPIKMLNDKAATYGVTYAVVDSAAGTDPAGVTLADDAGKWVGDGSDPGAGGGVTAYATIARAVRAIRNFNANRASARDDAGAGVVYLKTGNHLFAGATVSGGYGSIPKCFVTVTRFPGLNRSDVAISGTAGSTDLSDRIKVEGVKITSTTNNTFVNIQALWFNDCEFDCGGGSATGMIHATGNMCVYWTHCLMTGIRQGIHPFNGSAAMMPALVRGCNLDAFTRSILVYTVIGNKRSSSLAPVSTLLKTEIANQTFPVSDGFIIAFNKLLGFHLTSFDMVTVGDDFTRTGGAVVQNVFEVSTSNGTPNLMFTYAGEGETDNTPGDNIIFWHNTRVGGRCGTAYNSAGTAIKHRRFWSWKNNYDDSYGIKSDTFGTQNAARIGNFPVLYGVGHSGNVDAEINGTGTEGSFPNDFAGLSCRQHTTGQATATFPFVDRKSFTGVNGAGGGDYHLTAQSPGVGMPVDWVLPYDLEGSARAASNNATGAYVYGSAGAPAPQNSRRHRKVIDLSGGYFQRRRRKVVFSRS